MNDLLKNIIGKSDNFFLIAGPCIVENDKNPFEIAEHLVKVTKDLDIPFIFKASYKKANRSRLDSFTGIGDVEGLEIIKAVADKYNVPVVTDIHSVEEAELAAKYVDMLQIPAFLCRQTELVVAAAKTGKIVNIKKGQFLAPESMKFAVDKVLESGNNNVTITDRGTMFGYHDLIVDYPGMKMMQENTNAPVILDVTHSLQVPNQSSGVTGGNPQMIETVAKAGVAIGVDGLFMETHPDPANAKSDGANMLKLELMRPLMEKLVRVRKAVK